MSHAASSSATAPNAATRRSVWRRTVFKLDHVAQYWLDGKDLRADLYRERDKPHGYVELVLYTKPQGDEGEYKGTYEAIVHDGVGDNAEARQTKFKGKVECFVE